MVELAARQTSEPPSGGRAYLGAAQDASTGSRAAQSSPWPAGATAASLQHLVIYRLIQRVICLCLFVAYPWDRSNLKSMAIDLKKFEKLDAYAAKVDVKDTVEALVEVLLQKADSELEKVRAIWKWICHHIAYATVGSQSKEDNSGEDDDDILKTRKDLCEGYSTLLCQMCSLAGVQCVQLSGYAKGHNYKIGETFSGDGNHAWNAVYLDERWHLLDSTWGAGTVTDDCTHFKFDYDELYFFTHPAIFAEDHFPKDQDWQLLSTPLTIMQFENKMRHEKGFYNLGLLSSFPDTPIIKTVKGKAVIYVEARHRTLFMFDFDGADNAGLMTLCRFRMKLEIYPPEPGRYQLHIYAKPFSSSMHSMDNNTRVLSYRVDCTSVDRTMKIPVEMNNPVGPSWMTERKGFLQPSHPGAIIHTQDGLCSISFMLKEDMDILATLHSDDVGMTESMTRRHIFKAQQQNRVVLKIQIPKTGTFLLKIFYRKKGARASTYVYALCYILSCTNAAVKWPEFPEAYSAWLDSYDLVEPTAGVLPANQNVQFKLKVPGVSSVFVNDKKTGALTLSPEGYWEGSFNTAGSNDVDVLIEETPSTKRYIVILSYQVESK
ncbi:kyphoscoliosis peptidase-like [Lissotriton helveticus]